MKQEDVAIIVLLKAENATVQIITADQVLNQSAADTVTDIDQDQSAADTVLDIDQDQDQSITDTVMDMDQDAKLAEAAAALSIQIIKDSDLHQEEADQDLIIADHTEVHVLEKYLLLINQDVTAEDVLFTMDVLLITAEEVLTDLDHAVHIEIDHVQFILVLDVLKMEVASYL